MALPFNNPEDSMLYELANKVAQGYGEAIESGVREMLEGVGFDSNTFDLSNTKEIGQLLKAQGYDIILLGGVNHDPFDQIACLVNADRGFIQGFRFLVDLETYNIKRVPVSEIEVKILTGFDVAQELYGLRN